MTTQDDGLFICRRKVDRGCTYYIAIAPYVPVTDQARQKLLAELKNTQYNGEQSESLKERAKSFLWLSIDRIIAALQTPAPSDMADLDVLKRDVYTAYIKSCGWTDEMIAEALSDDPDWNYGYNYACQDALDDAIDHLASTGRLTAKPTEDLRQSHAELYAILKEADDGGYLRTKITYNETGLEERIFPALRNAEKVKS